MQKKTTAALIELHYLPCIQYFTKLLKYENITIEQCEHYQKRSYRNRCHIMGANGLMRLSIPLQKGKNQQMNIREVKIAYEENWQQLHWKSITSAYRNAPFFEYYADEISPFFKQKPTYLFDWNYKLLLCLLKLLQLETNLQLNENYHDILSPDLKDLRQSIQTKKYRQKEDLTFKAFPYPQVFEERHRFVANLSILDLLFCAGPQASLILENSISLTI